MGQFNYTQKKIALSLLKGEKTIPELGKMAGESDEVIEQSLNRMLELNLVEKKGEKFALKPGIVEEIKRRKEIEEKDSFNPRLKAFVEVQDFSEKLVKKHLESLEEKMKNDKDFQIYDLEIGEPEQQKDYFIGFVEVNFSAKSFSSIIKFVMVYGPSIVEVIKPRKIQFPAFDFQEGLADLTEWVYKYNNFIKKHMKKEEIKNFNKSLFQQKKK